MSLQPLINRHSMRFEFKYVLPECIVEDMKKDLLHFMEPDPVLRDIPRGEYPVRSLYFDDAGLSCYYDKTDGLHTRYKFRVRTYVKRPENFAPVFLELKGRFNQLVFKHRTSLMLNKSDVMLKARSLALKIFENAEKTPMVHKFYYELHRKRITPIVVVDYWRKPYVSKYEPQFRLTFDEYIYAAAASSLFPNDTFPKAILSGCVVMEIKFRFKIPAWFHQIVQNYELQQVPFSKMCKGVEACEIKRGLEHLLI